MKSPNKLVASLLMGMLSVSSVHPTSSVFSWRNLGKLVSSAADSSVAKTLTNVGHKVIANPGKTRAALVGSAALGWIAYKCWQNRNNQHKLDDLLMYLATIYLYGRVFMSSLSISYGGDLL